MSNLKKFSIIGLHGYKNVDSILEDNILIIVGENGSGKTTFLRILFLFLSGRWLSLVQFKFNYISAEINNETIAVTHSEIITAITKMDGRFLMDFPPPVRRKLIEAISTGDIENFSEELDRVNGRYGRTEFSVESLLQHIDTYDEGHDSKNKDLRAKVVKVKNEINAQILYLPTFRRIEKELNSIFGAQDADEYRKSKSSRYRGSENTSTYIELVEFGMRDVQQAIDTVLTKINNFARNNLQTLTLNYLGEVVDKKYKNTTKNEIKKIKLETMQTVAGRIDESILSASLKDKLIEIIQGAKTSKRLSEHEQVTAHYFLQLVDFQELLQEKERPISAFCKICSEYIQDKIFVYDPSSYSFYIEHKDRHRTIKNVTLSDLSSGEKQIVSLFSHMYLSDNKSFFVLIDEPELSLSVPWQRRFLEDINSGEFCKGIVAVTHSPFIYENSLKKYARSLGQFIQYPENNNLKS